MKTLLTQQISNLKTEGFTDVERFVNVTLFLLDGTKERVYLEYFITYKKGDIDVSNLFRSTADFIWHKTNNDLIAVRDSEGNITYEQVEVLDEEGNPTLDEEGNPTYQNGDIIKAPSFDYLMGIFEQYQAIPFSILRLYIEDLDIDGEWDL